MANEAQIRSSLQISVGNLEYRSQPTMFLADVAGTKGPVPGALQIATQPGTSIDFSELTTPGLCRLMNLDSTNFVTYGIQDPDTSIFYPLGELLAGETFVLRLSRQLQEELGTSTSTGTIGPDTNLFHMIADTAAVNVTVEAFEV